jgi:hypothetical protein
MKRNWMNKETGFTTTTWGENLPANPEKWIEITKEEKDARDAELLKAWAKRYNGAE